METRDYTVGGSTGSPRRLTAGEKLLVPLGRGYGAIFGEASQDLWKVLIDKAEAEADEKIKMIPQGQGIKAYGVVY